MRDTLTVFLSIFEITLVNVSIAEEIFPWLIGRKRGKLKNILYFPLATNYLYRSEYSFRTLLRIDLHFQMIVFLDLYLLKITKFSKIQNQTFAIVNYDASS